MTGKQRATLRKMANTIPALYQIGKDGVSENVIRQLDDALEARELIKIHVLESAMLTTREAADECAGALHAECIQTIGGKFVLYRQSRENPRIVLD